MTTFNIYKKRDGQDWKNVGDIYASNFDEAKKKFALNMTEENHSKSNDIVWLSKENDGVDTGWYDLNASTIIYNADETINVEESELEVFCSESDIKEGFSSWNEDVYTWEIRENLDYEEIYDMEDFEENKSAYKWFMAFDSEMFYLYNGDFQEIAEMEGLGLYSDRDDRFIGCSVEETETIKICLD